MGATSGDVYRHPNLRLAYIAQHAFQHLEKHLAQTPTQYILERFAGNDDKENIDFKAKANAQEVKVKKKFFVNPATNALKVCQDAKEAVAAGLQSKMLTSEGAEKHLMCFGLDKE